MDIDEMLRLMDESIFEQKGKRLNDFQRKVIAGVLNHQKYSDIADEVDRSEGHVKDVGYEILSLLSQIFEEPVNKSNLKSVLEGQKNINFNFGDGSIGSIRDISCMNFNSDQTKPSPDQNFQNKLQAKIKKLTKVGLSEVEIADLLEIDLDLVQNVELA